MMKHQWIYLNLLADFELIGVFAVSNLQILMGIAVILVFLLILFIIFVIAARIEKKNDLLMKEKIMPEIGFKYGKVISVSADALHFERNETIFAAKISLVKIKLLRIPEYCETEFEVKINLPKLQEKFFIQHQSVFSKYSAD